MYSCSKEMCGKARREYLYQTFRSQMECETGISVDCPAILTSNGHLCTLISISCKQLTCLAHPVHRLTTHTQTESRMMWWPYQRTVTKTCISPFSHLISINRFFPVCFILLWNLNFMAQMAFQNTLPISHSIMILGYNGVFNWKYKDKISFKHENRQKDEP